MKFLFSLLILLLGGEVFAQNYVTPDGKPILDLKSYLLEGGRVVEIPYRPSENYDISISNSNDIPVQDPSIGLQREFSQSQYRPPLSQSDLEIYRNSISSVLNAGRVQYSAQQQVEMANQSRVARNVDAINRQLPLMLQQLESLTKQVDELDSRDYIHRSSQISQRLREIKDSNFSSDKKRALSNLYLVKLNNRHIEGNFGKKYNAVKAKYNGLKEEDLTNEASYPFLDMGATSLKISEIFYDQNQTNDAEDALELSNTFLDIALGATPFVGTFKDAWEAYTGSNLISGDPLSFNERTVSVLCVGVGVLSGGMLGGTAKVFLSAESIAKIGFYSDKIFPLAKNVTDKAKNILDSAYKLGLKTTNGVVAYGKIFKAASSLPEGMRIVRIKEGIHPDKIAIIGRKMPGVVNVVADHFKSLNVKAETFQWTDEVEKSFVMTSKLFPDGIIPYEEVKKTLAYQANKEWAEKLVREGYTIFDIGDPHLADHYERLSAFYDLEKDIIFGIRR